MPSPFDSLSAELFRETSTEFGESFVHKPQRQRTNKSAIPDPDRPVSPQKMVTPDAKRDAVAQACLVHGVSQRRACEALEVDRSSMRYRSTRPADQELSRCRF